MWYPTGGHCTGKVLSSRQSGSATVERAAWRVRQGNEERLTGAFWISDIVGYLRVVFSA